MIGQSGAVRKETANQNYVDYTFQTDDHYVRAVVYNRDGSVFYLNPFVRYDGVKLDYPLRKSKVDLVKTYSFRSLLLVVACGLVFGAVKIFKLKLKHLI